MKKNRISIPLLFSALLLCCITACSFNNPPPAAEGAPGYYSKEIVLSTWVDPPYNTWWDEVEVRLYNEQGSLTVVLKHTYEEMDEPGYFMITRTDVYEVDDELNQSLIEYYLYSYHKDEYQYIDEDGIEIDAVDYLLERGETYTTDDVLRLFYVAVYDEAVPDADYETPDYDYYISIIDKRTSDSVTTAAQYATYVTDPDGGKHFRTEKYYLRNQDDTELILSKEFASWYDPGGYYDYLYDLYHSYRGDDNTEEFYYFTRYSRNETGYVYEQADYEYAWADGVDPEIADGSFDTTESAADTDGWNPGPLGPFNYTPEFDKIGPQASVLRTEYDERGNIILDERFFRGELTEYTTYSYNNYSELTDKCRYTDGGSLLRDKETVRFRDEVLYGQSYSVKETCEYKYYDYSDTESQNEESGRIVGVRMMHPIDSYTGEDEQQTRFIRYGKINNSYRK